MQKLPDSAVAELKLGAAWSAYKINQEHAALLADCEDSQAKARAARDRALVIGAELIKVKDGLGHGKFMSWVEVNCSFKRQTANNYMLFVTRNSQHGGNLPDDLSLRQAMIQLDIVPGRPREGGNTFRGSHVPSVYDPLNMLTKFLGAVDDSGTPQEWETEPEERRAVQQQYKPKLEEFILRLFGVRIELPGVIE